MELTHNAGAASREVYHPNYWSWAKSGMVAGFIAGIVFAIFEMIVAALTTGNFFGPLRMIAAVGLGPQAMTTEVSLGLASLVGVLIHVLYSVVAGAVFALIIAAIAPARATRTGIILTASLLGLLMWVINFYVLAPAMGWNWFPEETNAVSQFIAHTFMYGTVTGWYLAATKGKHAD